MAENIWKLRESKGLTPSQLAARAGMALALLLEYENGKLLSTDDQIRLARALYVDTSDIRLRSDPRPAPYENQNRTDEAEDRAPREPREPRPREDTPPPARYDSGSRYDTGSRYSGGSRYDTGSRYSGGSRYDSGAPRYGGGGSRYDSGAPRYGGGGSRYDSGAPRYGGGSGGGGGSRYEDSPPSRYDSGVPRYGGGGGDRPERRSYGPSDRPDRRQQQRRGAPKPPPPVRPNQIAHLLRLARHIGLNEDQLMDEIGKPLEDLNVREARYWLTQFDARAREMPERKAPPGYRAQRAHLPEAVDAFELNYLTNTQNDNATLMVKLLNGDTLTGTLVGFSTYTLTLRLDDATERTLQKLAVAYYERTGGPA